MLSPQIRSFEQADKSRRFNHGTCMIRDENGPSFRYDTSILFSLHNRSEGKSSCLIKEATSAANARIKFFVIFSLQIRE